LEKDTLLLMWVILMSIGRFIKQIANWAGSAICVANQKRALLD
jgi:hypothetical protein